MPSPIMFTEAAFLFGPGFAMQRPTPCRRGREFETWAKMHGFDIGQLDPALLRDAVETCARCSCRKACRRWLRTGVSSMRAIRAVRTPLSCATNGRALVGLRQAGQLPGTQRNRESWASLASDGPSPQLAIKLAGCWLSAIGMDFASPTNPASPLRRWWSDRRSRPRISKLR